MNRILAAAALVAVIGAGGAVAMAGQSTDPLTTAPRTPDVVSTPTATLSCPESPTDKQTQTDLMAVAPEVDEVPGSPAAGETEAGEGSVSVMSRPGQALAELTSRAAAAALELTPADAPSVVVSGTGSIAPGLSAAQWSTLSKDAGNGLSASLCQAPRDEWNFGAVSTAVGATTRLVVSNPTPAVAVYNLTFFGPDGVVDAVGARGLALAPHAQESLDLAQFAPGVEAMAVNITVESGRVVAAVHTDLVVGNDAAGSEWIAPSVAADTDVLVNPGPAGRSEQELQIANMSDREALVQVQIINETGPFSPTALQDLRVAPGAVLSERLTAIIGKDVASVHLVSTMPVIASIVATPRRSQDFVVSSSSPSILEPAVVPLIPDAELTLALASQNRAGGGVAIAAYTASGREVGVTSVNLKGRTTRTWQPDTRTAQRADYLVVSLPAPVDVHGVAHFEGADGVASLPVVSGTYTLSKPSVLPATP